MSVWLAGWNKRIRITLSNVNVDSDLMDFTVLLYLSASSGTGNADVTAVFDEVGSHPGSPASDLPNPVSADGCRTHDDSRKAVFVRLGHGANCYGGFSCSWGTRDKHAESVLFDELDVFPLEVS